MSGQYTITLSDGVTNFIVYPNEINGTGYSTPRQIAETNLTGGAGINYFKLAGDLTYRFIPGFVFLVENSAANINDGAYTVATAVYSAPYTLIHTTTAILNAGLPLGYIKYQIPALEIATPLNVGGTGVMNYGSILLQDIVHVVENFANVTAPTPALKGQLWFDTSSTPPQLKVHDGANFISSQTIFAGPVAPASPSLGQLWYDTVVPQLKIYNGATWDSVADRYVLKSGDTMTGALDMGTTNKITNLADATAATDAMNQQSSDARYVNTSGDTMTGALSMSSTLGTDGFKITNLADASNPLDAMNQQSSDARYVNAGISGDTMLGTLTMGVGANINMGSNTITNLANPTVGTDALNLATAGSLYIAKTGGTMTGSLILAADPTTNLEAATKQYVDILVTAGASWINPLKDPDIQDVVSAQPVLAGTVGQTFTYIKFGGVQGEIWNNGGTTVAVSDGDVVQAIITNAIGPVADWTQIQASPLTVGDRYGIAFEHGTIGATLSGIGFVNDDIIQYVGGNPNLFASWSLPNGRGQGALPELSQGTTALISDPQSYHYGHTYLYDAVGNSWIEISGPGTVGAGSGLSYSGNTLNVGTVSSSRIVVNADNIDLATTGIVANTYNNLTVDAYGRATAGSNVAYLVAAGPGPGTYNNVTIDAFNNATGSNVAYLVAAGPGPGTYNNVTIDAFNNATGSNVAYLTSINSSNVTTALGYTPANSLILENTQATSYVLALSDAGKLVTYSSGSAGTITIPLNSTVAFPIGTVIAFTQDGTGQLTIVPTGGVTIRTEVGYKLNAQYAMASILKVGTDTWRLSGSLKV